MKLLKEFLDRLGYRPKGTMKVEAVIIRADGTKEDLGVIAEGQMDFKPSTG